MAKKKKTEPTTITLVIPHESGRLKLDTLVNAIRDNMCILSNVARDHGSSLGSGAEWTVTAADLKSPFHLSVVPKFESGPAVIASIVQGVKLLNEKSQRPQHFSDETLESLGRLAKIGARFESSTSKPVELTDAVAINITELMTEAGDEDEVGIALPLTIGTHTERMTIYGDLRDLITSSSVWKFIIVTFAGKQRVNCTFGGSQFTQEELDRIEQSIPKPVAAHGLAKVNRLGDVTSMEVEGFVELPSKGKLPNKDDIIKTIDLGKGDPFDIVQGMRDEG